VKLDKARLSGKSGMIRSMSAFTDLLSRFEVPLPIQEEAYIMTDRLPSPFISPRSSIDKRSIVLNSALSDRSAQSPTTCKY
jgi:hypothetical protein